MLAIQRDVEHLHGLGARARAEFLIENSVTVACGGMLARAGPGRDAMIRIIAAVEKGTPTGPYSSQLTNTERSLALIFADIGITKHVPQHKVLTNLLDSGRITKVKWRPCGGKAKTLTGLGSNGITFEVDWARLPTSSGPPLVSELSAIATPGQCGVFMKGPPINLDGPAHHLSRAVPLEVLEVGLR